MSTELFCHRCGAVLEPGRGNFYVARIEAFADPTPPPITAEQLRGDIAGQIDELIGQMRDSSERELADQVHRRLTLHLCESCYAHWIERPTG